MRLDYGNSTTVSIPTYLMRRLQSALNAAALLICHLMRSDNVTDSLVSLYWLRVYWHIESTQRWRTTVSEAVHLHFWLPSLTGVAFLLEPIGWLCLQLDWPPLVAAELFRLPPPKPKILYTGTHRLSSHVACSPPWSRRHSKTFYYDIHSAYSSFVDLVSELRLL